MPRDGAHEKGETPRTHRPPHDRRLSFHPGQTPEDIAKGLRAEEDVDEIAKLCANLAAAGYIEPLTPH